MSGSPRNGIKVLAPNVPIKLFLYIYSGENAFGLEAIYYTKK